jgi:hypothetical protein
MTDHPYANAPGYRRWNQAVARTPPDEIDPMISAPFRIGRTDRIASAGSCFAQHIAQRLQQRGFDYMVAETAHPLLPADVAQTYGYGVYSARYGNVYTGRQMLQLLHRAYGRFNPRDNIWEENARFLDPYRPAIQPDGFATREEFELDRQQHFAAVRRAIETMDVFIFTLGLTECWAAVSDGAIYPMCPGTLGGQFDPARHMLLNFSVADVVSDMHSFIREVRALNPGAKFVLTVSPVPLAATAEDRHVLLSTVYSKSVLRIAAEELAKLPNVAYFPAYEIVTGAFSRGRYFSDDLRGVTADGVDHVMRIFFRHLTSGGDEQMSSSTSSGIDPHLQRSSEAVAAICEEEHLDVSGSSGR